MNETMREKIGKMSRQEMSAETLIAQIRIANALEKTARYLESIADNVEKMRVYYPPLK